MAYGPVELVVVEFSGNRFRGEIIPALLEVLQREIVRIVDLVFVRKDADGSAESVELSQVDPELARSIDPEIGAVTGLVSDSDLEEIGRGLAPNSSAVLLLFEHRWAERLTTAVAGAGGRIVDSIKIPAHVVNEIAESAEQTSATVAH
jgi:uncharacterized membrane protein